MIEPTYDEQWEAEEAESLAELARGEGITFATPEEAAAWLLSHDSPTP